MGRGLESASSMGKAVWPCVGGLLGLLVVSRWSPPGGLMVVALFGDLRNGCGA